MTKKLYYISKFRKNRPHMVWCKLPVANGNGFIDLKLLLDTGSSVTCFPRETLERVGYASIGKSDKRTQMIGWSDYLPQYQIRDLYIQDGFIFPSPIVDGIPSDLDDVDSENVGILGLDFIGVHASLYILHDYSSVVLTNKDYSGAFSMVSEELGLMTGNRFLHDTIKEGYKSDSERNRHDGSQ